MMKRSLSFSLWVRQVFVSFVGDQPSNRYSLEDISSLSMMDLHERYSIK